MNQNKEIRGFRKILHSKKTAPHLSCLPFIVSFLIFFLYPTINTVFMGSQKVEGFNNVKWTGLNNYKCLFNIHFHNALRSDTIYMVCMISIMPVLPIATTILLNSEILKFRNSFRSAIFAPALTSVIMAGIAFRPVFGETEADLFNSIILELGGEAVAWRIGYVTEMIMIVTPTAWRELSISMMYCLFTSQSIPEELYKAANTDGANTIQRFVFVAIPQVRPVIIYILTLTILSGYRVFTEGYVYWNKTNPEDIGLIVIRCIYQQVFQRNDFGMGSAIGVVLLAVVLTVNMFQLNLSGPFKKEDI